MTLHLQSGGETRAEDRVIQRALEEIEREFGDMSPDRRRGIERILRNFKDDLEALQGSFW